MARRHHRFTVDRKTRQIRTVIDVVNHFLKATALALVLVLGTLGSAAATAGSVDLPKYQRSGAYDLPIGSGANLLADEASAVTYNWDTKTLFVVGDGGTSITQLSLTGALIDSMTPAADASKPQGTYFYDPEGLAYVGNGQFVLGEERTRQLHLLTYTAGTTHGAAGTQTVKLGTTIGNIGRRLGAAGRGGAAPCGPLRRPRPRTHFCSRFARSIHPLKVVIMFKKFALALAVAAALPASALTTGDLAFTAFNADEDGFSLVTFVDIAANTQISFSDSTATNATTIGTGESAFSQRHRCHHHVDRGVFRGQHELADLRWPDRWYQRSQADEPHRWSTTLPTGPSTSATTAPQSCPTPPPSASPPCRNPSPTR